MANDVTSILVASPREPSGISWLINCLLELGIRVNFKSTVDRVWRVAGNQRDAAAMWEPAAGGGWRLHPRAEALQKWVPILAQRETFSFRPGVEVECVQDLPARGQRPDKTALFVRDPRDAINSLYRRTNPDMTLSEFARFPHFVTLLDAIGQWQLFVESWLARDGILVYRFEDYKADGAALLTRILHDFEIDATPEEVERAAAASSFEQAQAVEAQYRASHPGDSEVAMRAGRVGEWQGAAETLALATEIEDRLRTLLTRLGYAVGADPTMEPAAEPVSQLRFLQAFEEIDLAPARRAAALAADPLACPRLADLLHVAATLDAATIRRARLEAREARLLIDSLQEYSAAWRELQRTRLDAARAEFGDGAGYHVTRMKELLLERRAARKEGS